MMIFFWIILIGVLYYLFHDRLPGKDTAKCSSTPEAILKNRFVNGEIDEDTYKRMITTLNKEGK